MKVEDLKNTKIYLPNETDRLKFKRKVVKLGIKWVLNDWDDPLFNDVPFIYIDALKEIYTACEKDFASFCSSRYKQIFLDDVLAIKEPKEECEFKPFDKVLVRNYIDIDKWIPRLFAEYDGDARYRKYKTTDGNCYNCCIPYEGNEHLVGQPKI